MTFRLLPILTAAALLALPAFAQAATSTHGAIQVSATVVATCTVSATAATSGAAIDCARQADFSVTYEQGTLAATADQDPIQTTDGVTEVVTY